MNTHKLFYFFFILFVFQATAQNNTFKVMAWNIFHGANDIKNGKENAIKIIKEINPDIILMVETYGSGKLIAESLGYNFHLIAKEGTALDNKNVNLSIFSKYPFGERIDTKYPFYLGGREVIIHNQKIRFFSNWFHYTPWSDAPETMGKSAKELLAWEQTGSKFKMIQNVLPYLKKYTKEADDTPIIFGGDMNTPSHKDWDTQAKKLHNDLIVPWYATKVLEEIGFIDSYRKENPNPNTHPGITWNTKGKNDAHRIDYIFYKGKSIRSIKSEAYQVYFNEPFRINSKVITYPSDHGFVVTTFEIK